MTDASKEKFNRDGLRSPFGQHRLHGKRLHDGGEKIEGKKEKTDEKMRIKNRREKPYNRKRKTNKETILCIQNTFLIFLQRDMVEEEEKKIGDQRAERGAEKPEARGEQWAERERKKRGGKRGKRGR